MKRASYRDAIDWIAQNDSAGDSDRLDPEVCANLVSVVLIASIFDVPTEKVGADIVHRRRTIDRDERSAARFLRKVEAGDVKDLLGKPLTLADLEAARKRQTST